MVNSPDEKSRGCRGGQDALSPDTEASPMGLSGFSASSHRDDGEASPSKRDAGKLESELKELFEAQKFAVLATHCSGSPYGNLVAFASSEDISSLSFVTSRYTRKYENISANGRVAIVIDSRSNQLRDFSDAMAVTALGRALEIEEPGKSDLLRCYLEKHPNLEEFATSPSCALFSVDVEKYIIVSRFQDVTELCPNR